MDERKTIAKNIELLIKQSGMCLTQIATELALDNSTVAKYIKGVAIPSLLQFKKLCKVLGCDYEEILD